VAASLVWCSCSQRFRTLVKCQCCLYHKRNAAAAVTCWLQFLNRVLLCTGVGVLPCCSAQVYDSAEAMATEEDVISKHTTPAYRPPEVGPASRG
jgi:hypothetical protein